MLKSGMHNTEPAKAFNLARKAQKYALFDCFLMESLKDGLETWYSVFQISELRSKINFLII